MSQVPVLWYYVQKTLVFVGVEKFDRTDGAIGSGATLSGPFIRRSRKILGKRYQVALGLWQIVK